MPGTAILAQLGILLLFFSVWASLLLVPLNLFTFHPLLNVTALLLLVQSILLLQPTHTPAQKRSGTLLHATLNLTSLALLLASLFVIEWNKFSHAGDHFVSAHAILGLVTYVFIVVQVAVGAGMYFAPALFGGVEQAKKIYKWHRASGYLVLVLLLSTVAAATQTSYNLDTLGIKLWAVIVAAVLVLVGIVPRIRPAKFGFGTSA